MHQCEIGIFYPQGYDPYEFPVYCTTMIHVKKRTFFPVINLQYATRK